MEKSWNWYLGENHGVRPTGADEAPPAKIPDEWWEKVVKGVPAEVVGAYTALIVFLKVPGSALPLFVGFVLGLLGTVVAMTVLRGISWNNPDPRLRRVGRIQIVVALLAFAVWAYAQGGFFAVWNPTIGSGADVKVLHFYEDYVAGALVVVMGFVLLVSDKLAGQPS